MCHKDQFERELTSRNGGSFDTKYVIDILMSYTGDSEHKLEFSRKGLGNFPYCLVMNAGDRSLHDILSKGKILYYCRIHNKTFILYTYKYIVL